MQMLCNYRDDRLWRSISLGLCCLCLTGCGSDHWQAATQPAQGTLRINGQIPTGAVVTLYREGEAIDIRQSRPWGMVDDQGVYQLRTYEQGDGAPLGHYTATVVWSLDPSQPGSPDMLAGAYDEPSESKWQVTVIEGQAELEPIEIQGAKVVKAAPRQAVRGPTPFDAPGAQ